MDRHRLGIIVSVTLVSIAAIAMSLLLMKSMDVAVALGLMSLFVALLFVDPFLGLVLYIACFYIRPQSFIPILVTAKLTMVIGAGTLASMFVRSAFESKAIRLFRTPMDKLIWCFFLAVVLSRLVHANIDGAMQSGVTIGKWVILYFLFTNLVTSTRRVSIIGQLLGFVTLVLAIQGIVQFYTGAGIGGQTVHHEERIRSLGIFANPTSLATGLLVGLPFVFFGAQRIRSLAMRVCAVLGVATILFALYLTNSRGAILGLGAMASILLVRRKGWVGGMVLSAMVFALIFAIGPSRMTKFSLADPSAYGRILAWEDGFRMFASNPLFGVGQGVWGSWEHPQLVAHNSLIHCAAELGIIGVLTWVLLILLAIRCTYFAGLRAGPVLSENLQLNTKMIFFACVAWVVNAIFLSIAYSALLFMIFGMASATTNVVVAQQRERCVLFEKKDLLYGLLITIGGMVAFWLFVIVAKV